MNLTHLYVFWTGVLVSIVAHYVGRALNLSFETAMWSFALGLFFSGIGYFARTRQQQQKLERKRPGTVAIP